jgi:hypothetical protein
VPRVEVKYFALDVTISSCGCCSGVIHGLLQRVPLFCDLCLLLTTSRRSQDKRFAELQATSDEIKNKMKINDFLSLQTLFEKLNKQLEKTLRTSEGVYMLSMVVFASSHHA